MITHFELFKKRHVPMKKREQRNYESGEAATSSVPRVPLSCPPEPLLSLWGGGGGVGGGVQERETLGTRLEKQLHITLVSQTLHHY